MSADEPGLETFTLWVVYAEADAEPVGRMLDLLRRTRLKIETFTAPDPKHDGPRSADRVLLVWSRQALGDEAYNHAISRCTVRHGDRLAVLPLDRTPMLSSLRPFRRERLMSALAALGEGEGPGPLDRLLERVRRVERVGNLGYLAVASCALALLVLFGVRTPTPALNELDRLQVSFFLGIMLAFSSGCLALFWSWLDGRFLAQRAARFLVDRSVDRVRVSDLR